MIQSEKIIKNDLGPANPPTHWETLYRPARPQNSCGATYTELKNDMIEMEHLLLGESSGTGPASKPIVSNGTKLNFAFSRGLK